MLNLVPLSELTGPIFAATATCPICRNEFASEAAKNDHLNAQHPNWALTMMSAYLRQIPRENG